MAAAFHRAGHRVLSEDTTCVRLGPEPAVVPGPAMLRVRHDVAAELELPSVRRVGESDDRVHYALVDPGDCEPVPVRAVVFLDASAGAGGARARGAADAARPLGAQLPAADGGRRQALVRGRHGSCGHDRLACTGRSTSGRSTIIWSWCSPV